MSAVRILALGSLVMSISAASSPGGSIHPASRVHRQPAERMTSAPTSLVFEPTSINPVVGRNSTHDVAAENLAVTAPAPNPSFSYVAARSTMPQGSISGLFLGVTGVSPAAASNSSASTSNPAGNSVGNVLNGVGQSSPLPSPAPAPAPAMSLTTAPTAVKVSADAFINFESVAYPEASSLVSGTPQSFSNSPVFAHLFGPNGPGPGDIANFEREVLSTIKSTYNNAGLSINLTSDPGNQAAHTISVVSGASYSSNPGAIGITDVGNNGFSFIDKFSGVQTVDQLATAIGHNISHELMHAFGIANHPEQVGPYVDAASSTLQTLTDPGTGFSPAAANLLSTMNFQAVGQSVTAGAQVRVDGDQILINGASTVPEPSTVALWTVVSALVIARRRRKAA